MAIKQASEMALVPASAWQQLADQASCTSLNVAKFELSHLIVCPPNYDPERARASRGTRLHHVLPPLRGPYTVGHASLIVDGPKSHPKVGSVSGDSKIGIEIFAPTRKGGNTSPLRMQLNANLPLQSALSRDQLHTLVTHSLGSLQPYGKMPVLIFSHGLGVDPVEYRILLEEIASHGFAVLSLNHPSSSGHAPFRPGEALNAAAIDYCERSEPARFREEIEKLGQHQASNIRHVVALVRDGSLREFIAPTEEIILGGHSLGGAASILVTRTDPQIRACINVDGYLHPDGGTPKATGIQQPLLQLLAGGHEMVPEWDELHANSPHAHKAVIPNVGHMDFTASPILEGLLGEKSMYSALKAHRAASRTMQRFMSKALGH